AAAVGSAAGAFVGITFGAVLAGDAGAVIGAALLAMAGDVFALVNVGVITNLARGKGYLVALTVPCVIAYLLAWLVAGLVAGVSSGAAAVLVVLLIVGPVLAVAALRLTRDFSDPALALVLERRFPKVLGDRLITAVELANPKEAARLGYSEVMIEQTIHQAAELVGTVPVREVFDWRRMVRYYLGVLVSTVGLYLLAAVNLVPLLLRESDLLRGPAVLGAMALDAYAFFAFSFLIFGRGHTRSSSVRYVAPSALFLLVQVAAVVYVLATTPVNGLGDVVLGVVIRLAAALVLVALGCFYMALRSGFGPKRRRYGYLVDVPILIVAALGLGGLAYARPGAVSDYAKSFNDTAGLWVERDLFLQNTIWPRRAYLEVLDWPESRDKHVGKDESALSLHVRGYRWVVASNDSAEGWRPLTWKDLQEKKSLLGAPLPDVDFRENDEHGKKDWGKPRDENAGWTLDEIETHLNRPETQNTIDADTNSKLREVFAQLERRAADPAMRRTLRQLMVPSQVRVRYRGPHDGGELTLQLQADNEYSGQFPDLKDKVYFTARGEDYETPKFWITVVPPPMLVEMAVDEEQPAYMHYRVSGDDPGVLRGLKQAILGRPISVSGDTSRIEGVPAGSNVVLTGKSDKELSEVVIDEPRKGAAVVKGDVRLLDPHTFAVRFDDVQTTYDFYFRFVDTENVKAERHVIIKPSKDAAPDVRIDVKILRKKGADYLVTPSAFVPLEAAVKDDRGLSNVEYACTVTKLDRQAEQSGRGLFVLSALHLLPGGPGQELVAASRVAALSRDAKSGPKPAADAGPQRFPVPTFRVEDRFQPIERIREALQQPRARAELKREFAIEKLEDRDVRNKDTDPPYFFALDQVKNPEGGRLKVEDRDATQPRYKLQLWMEAVDTDVETGADTLTTPRGVQYKANRGRSTNTISFLVIPESDLLAEIAKEEDTLYIKLGEQIKRLKDGLDKLDDMKRDLTVEGLKEPQFVAMQARSDELKQTLEKGELTVGEVSADYQRILKELITNRVEPAVIERVQKQIVEPLNAAVSGDENNRNANDTFPRVRAGIADLQTAVSAQIDLNPRIQQSRTANDEARVRLNGLIKRLSDVLDKMEQGVDLNR
ncbi:MAG TPA: MFS transporter, partial [Gemmataceae bacterium]|nr:MFS transporter [Gemmataceae bacterium]